jgi:2-succinyl-5-enolpyruvyl-6-hydroxy-3-cyclohexene-1-carboxylate synthase
MDQAKVNDRFAITFADQLAASGVEHVCLAPGSRSAPLAMAFARHPRLRVWVMVDERSCAFFAVGLAKTTERPVAVVCTSGTAAAELHPAVVEADMSRTPLVVLTADRPPELIGVGANQAIDQARIYGGSVRWYADPGPPDDRPDAARGWRRLAARAVAEAMNTPAGPVHLNLPFREPLVPGPGELAEPMAAPAPSVSTSTPAADLSPLIEAVAAAERPVLVAGELRAAARARSAAGRLQVPLLAEPSSHLRLANLPYDAILRDAAWAAAHQPDVVVRVGATPTSKPLNGWLAASGARTFLVDPAGWRDPDLAATDVLRADPLAAVEAMTAVQAPAGWRSAWAGAGRAAVNALDAALDSAPMFEAHAVRALAETLPEEASVFVGSSMPIRDVDTFWPGRAAQHRFLGNRGASGIDGLVSTGLGMAAADSSRPAVLLLGDLSLYHDMNGLWAIGRHGLRATVVVLDNGGGGIFSFLPQALHEDVFEEVFGTPLGLRLEDVARLYDLDFCRVEDKDVLKLALARALDGERSAMVVVRFTRSESVAGHRACWSAVAAALGH